MISNSNNLAITHSAWRNKSFESHSLYLSKLDWKPRFVTFYRSHLKPHLKSLTRGSIGFLPKQGHFLILFLSIANQLHSFFLWQFLFLCCTHNLHSKSVSWQGREYSRDIFLSHNNQENLKPLTADFQQETLSCQDTGKDDIPHYFLDVQVRVPVLFNSRYVTHPNHTNYNSRDVSSRFS